MSTLTGVLVAGSVNGLNKSNENSGRLVSSWIRQRVKQSNGHSDRLARSWICQQYEQSNEHSGRRASSWIRQRFEQINEQIEVKIQSHKFKGLHTTRGGRLNRPAFPLLKNFSSKIKQTFFLKIEK